MPSLFDDSNKFIKDITIFYNEVAETGYWWRSELKELPSLSEIKYKLVNPLKEPQKDEKGKDRLPPAFKTFIDTAPSKTDSFIEFANQYGRLIPKDKQASGKYSDLSFPPQSWAFWVNEHTDMKQCHDIFLAAQSSEKISLLGNVTDIYYKNIFEVKIDSAQSLKDALNNIIEKKWTLFFAPKTELPMHKFLLTSSDLFNCKNPTLTTITMIWIGKFIAWNSTFYHCEYSQQYDASKNKWFPLIRPDSLLAAMWYQFAEWVAGKRKYKYCAYCNSWQDVTLNQKNWEMHKDCGSKARVQLSRDNMAKKKALEKPKNNGKPAEK